MIYIELSAHTNQWTWSIIDDVQEVNLCHCLKMSGQTDVFARYERKSGEVRTATFCLQNTVKQVNFAGNLIS